MQFLRDIRNFLIIRKAIKKVKKSDGWKKHNFRCDWYCRIYTVINPTPSDNGDSVEVLKIKVLEKAKAYHSFIDNMKISDLVFTSLEHIPDSESFLLVYSPIMNYWTTWRFIKFLFFTILGVLLSSKIIEWGEKLINYITNF